MFSVSVGARQDMAVDLEKVGIVEMAPREIPKSQNLNSPINAKVVQRSHFHLCIGLPYLYLICVLRALID